MIESEDVSSFPLIHGIDVISKGPPSSLTCFCPFNPPFTLFFLFLFLSFWKYIQFVENYQSMRNGYVYTYYWRYRREIKREICQSHAVLNTQFTLTYKLIGRLYKHSIDITWKYYSTNLLIHVLCWVRWVF